MTANEVVALGSKLRFDREKYKYQRHIVILCDFSFSVSVLIYRYTVPMGIFPYVIILSSALAWKHVHIQFRVRLNHGTIYIPHFLYWAKLYNALLHRIYLLHTLLATKSVDATLDFCSKMIHIIFTRHSTQHRMWYDSKTSQQSCYQTHSLSVLWAFSS